MIEVSTSTAFLLYLGFALLTLLGLWSWQHYQTRQKRLSLIAQELLVCEYCHTAYLGDIGKQVTRCPCCRSFNKPISRRL